MPNRLAQETSPYLLQHAENPVDWYPWGDEALSRAVDEDRPILLSIGYSACHWCHVMERESFENPDTAALMNELFVNVKVDREERPDLDSIYMRAVQSLTGGGGWPLTVFLTPDGRPFFGGTYFPPEPVQGMPSFRVVLQAVQAAFQTRRDEVTRTADEIVNTIRRSLSGSLSGAGAEQGEPDRHIPERSLISLASTFDPVQGGFGPAPKFPQPTILEFLLRHFSRTRAEQALTMAALTLDRMAAGGMHDQLGGGFHRYSVDSRWLVPHFEKMLYDNALLLGVYSIAYQVTGDERYGEVAEQTAGYLLADLGSPQGGFYSARDADSEGEEGLFYVWTPDELAQALGSEEAVLFGRCYDVSAPGNFEGRSILHLPHDLEAVASSVGVSLDELRARLSGDRDTLLQARADRTHPHRDEKILADWNGLTIRALAEAGAALGRSELIRAAADGVAFVLGTMRSGERLFHSYKDGRARIPGFLADYGAVGNACVSLYEATFDPRWLKEARWAAEAILRLFWQEDGIFLDAPSDGEELIVPPRDLTDGATPSGTSLAVDLLLRTGRLFDEARYLEVVTHTLARESTAMERFPAGFGRLLSVLDSYLAEPVEVAIIASQDDPAADALHRVVMRRYLPNRVVVGGTSPEVEDGITLPLLEGKTARDGVATAYVCRGRSCSEPITDPEALARELEFR